MRQKLKINAEFLLPENFRGGYLEALELYTKYIKDTWDNEEQKIKYPVNLPERYCFPFTLEKGGGAYTTFSIESFAFDMLGDDIESDQCKQEDLEEELCSESDQ